MTTPTPLSRRSAASATGSSRSVFFWARLKLTGIYVAIVASILIGMSALLYQSLARNLTDASDDNFSGVESHHHFVENTLANVANEIILIDLVILLATAGISYLLAGYTLRPIQRALEAQKMFSENASHELRTPLAVMKSDTEVLLRNPNPSKELIRGTLVSTIEEIDRMTKLATDLLVLARSGHAAPLALERIDLALVLGALADKMRAVAEKKGIVLTHVAKEALPFLGNKIDLERILMNLIQNAIDHTEAAGSVALTASKDAADALLTIRDSGSGIDPADLPHIFERFYKGKGTSGSGLGLSIVKGLLEQYHGRISIESTLGKGTTVMIRFPLEA
jgi:two-component system sensor histidine kinase CiaH